MRDSKRNKLLQTHKCCICKNKLCPTNDISKLVFQTNKTYGKQTCVVSKLGIYFDFMLTLTSSFWLVSYAHVLTTFGNTQIVC